MSFRTFASAVFLAIVLSGCALNKDRFYELPTNLSPETAATVSGSRTSHFLSDGKAFIDGLEGKRLTDGPAMMDEPMLLPAMSTTVLLRYTQGTFLAEAGTPAELKPGHRYVVRVEELNNGNSVALWIDDQTDGTAATQRVVVPLRYAGPSFFPIFIK